MISVLIIEDNPAAAKALKEILAENKNLNVLEAQDTLAKGEEAIQSSHPSLVFLDVELPDGNGIEFWDRIRDQVSWNMYVVFYTAYDHYAIEALRARAHDFLVKPVIKADVKAALERFFVHCAENYAMEDMQTRNGGCGSRVGRTENMLLVLDQLNNHVAIRPKDVGFFHYIPERKVWEVFCTAGGSYILRHGINSARLLQTCPTFQQVHKSYIVNLDHVASIDSSYVVLLPPFDAAPRIPVSKVYKTTLFERFCQL